MTESLISRLESAAERGKAVTIVETDQPERLEWAQLHDDARTLASSMQSLGVAPGDTVAVLGPTSRQVLTAIQATWLAGAAVTILPLRTRLMSENEFGEQTRSRLDASQVSLAVCDPELAPLLDPRPGGLRLLFLDEIDRQRTSAGGSRYERPRDDPDATAIVQFTSGSTADPMGVVIPHRCVMDNNDAVAERAPINADDDVVVSWAPLYHDMGLVFLFVYAMTVGADMVLSTPTRFMASPGRWMRWMSEFGGTFTIGPNSSFSLASRLLARSASLDLSRCRRLGNGSEPVDPKAMDDFTTAAAVHGLDPSSLFAAYGMAEATVCISIPDAGTGFTDDFVDGDVLEYELEATAVSRNHPRARRLARCGRPVRGMEVHITDPETGRVLGERAIGEIEVRGPSVVPGYFHRPDAARTAFRDGGWLRTGDLGYLAEADLVICGRLKDMIIVGGRNLLPTDLERVVDDVDGVRRGNVIAFGIEGRRGREAVVVVAETKIGDVAKLRKEIASAVHSAAGIRPEEVVLVPKGTLPKTSSGKLRRSICRARYLTSDLETL